MPEYNGTNPCSNGQKKLVCKINIRNNIIKSSVAVSIYSPYLSIVVSLGVSGESPVTSNSHCTTILIDDPYPYMHGSAHTGQKWSASTTSQVFNHHSINYTISFCIKYYR